MQLTAKARGAAKRAARERRDRQRIQFLCASIAAGLLDGTTRLPQEEVARVRFTLAIALHRRRWWRERGVAYGFVDAVGLAIARTTRRMHGTGPVRNVWPARLQAVMLFAHLLPRQMRRARLLPLDWGALSATPCGASDPRRSLGVNLTLDLINAERRWIRWAGGVPLYDDVPVGVAHEWQGWALSDGIGKSNAAQRKQAGRIAKCVEARNRYCEPGDVMGTLAVAAAEGVDMAGVTRWCRDGTLRFTEKAVRGAIAPRLPTRGIPGMQVDARDPGVDEEELGRAVGRLRASRAAALDRGQDPRRTWAARGGRVEAQAAGPTDLADAVASLEAQDVAAEALRRGRESVDVVMRVRRSDNRVVPAVRAYLRLALTPGTAIPTQQEWAATCGVDLREFKRRLAEGWEAVRQHLAG